MASRRQNEQEFKQWEVLPEGGRRYWRDRRGRIHGFQRFVKIVDADENTLQVVQEIYNDRAYAGVRSLFPVGARHAVPLHSVNCVTSERD